MTGGERVAEIRKIISARLNAETINKLDQLVTHFNENSLGKVTRTTILEYLILDFYDKYVNQPSQNQ